MGLLDKTPWSRECWEPNNSINCGSSIPALRTVGIDSWSPHSKTQTEDHQSTCCQYGLHTASILRRKKNWDVSQPFSTQPFQQLSGSWRPPAWRGTEIARWPCSPSYSSTRTISWRWWIHPNEFTVKPWRRSPTETALNCTGLGLLLTWVFLDLIIDQNWTFQTGKECKMLGAGFQRAVLI